MSVTTLVIAGGRDDWSLKLLHGQVEWKFVNWAAAYAFADSMQKEPGMLEKTIKRRGTFVYPVVDVDLFVQKYLGSTTELLLNVDPVYNAPQGSNLLDHREAAGRELAYRILTFPDRK